MTLRVPLLLRRVYPRQNVRPTFNYLSSSHSTKTRSFHTNNDALEELELRGLVAQVTSREKLTEVVKKPVGVYAGIDPTASYLHVGHLLPLLSLYHFHIRGHRVIPLIGGATGLIGDPSGRSTERPLSSTSQVEQNVNSLRLAVSKFFYQTSKYVRRRYPTSSLGMEDEPEVKSNLEWFKGMGLLEFLRKVGVHARVNTMTSRDSVQSRLSSQQGISYTEFTYQLLQAYDFYNLHTQSDCTIQIGGSDQWGNIVAGIDLIHRLTSSTLEVEKDEVGSEGREEKVFGVTTPLLTTASGAKFGKSAGNAVALDERVTSVFDFYQFFLRVADADVGRYLKMFTLLPVPMIEERIKEHEEKPETRLAQRLLAAEVTELIHGDEAVRRAEIATRVLYERDLGRVKTVEVVNALKGNHTMLKFCEREKLVEGLSVAKLAVEFGLVGSNSAAKQLISAKGLHMNNQNVADYHQKVRAEDLVDGGFIILRSGSQRQIVIALT